MNNLTRTPALTLINPWAALICTAGKSVENRTWMPPEYVTNLLIHAGKRWDVDAQQNHHIDRATTPTSAIVALVDLTFACNSSLHRDTRVCGCDPKWAIAGQCHWNLTNVRVLPNPVPATGKQGLWRPDRDTIAAVAEQLTNLRTK